MSEQRKRLSKADITDMVMKKNLEKLLVENQTFRQFCWTLLVQASIFAPTHSPGSPYDTSYNEGRRSLGLEVLHLLRAIRPDVLTLLEREGSLLDEAKSREAATTPDLEEDEP